MRAKRNPIVVLLVVACIALASAVSASGATFELASASIVDIQRAFDSGELTAETLVQRCIQRIEAFDDADPRLNAILALNPNAIERARALDNERKRQGPRSLLHGIPVLLKDNFDTSDMPTTGGTFLLAGSLPPDDAFLVRRLREAGAIILAKTNMSELASGDARSSIGGVTRNPHDIERSPSGSSQGTAVGIASMYAPLGLGTDTGGSIRLPAAATGIVGLRPTQGLLSRDGIVPLSTTFDMAGPMARRVSDVAVALGILSGVDEADPTTHVSASHRETDYTAFLDEEALNGARIGVARQFFGHDADVDWVMEASLDAIRDAGATLVDVEFPGWLMLSRVDLYWTLRRREFNAAMTEYLSTLAPRYPKTVAEMHQRALRFSSPSPEGYVPNASRWHLLKSEAESGGLDSNDYVAVRDHGLPLLREMIGGPFEAERLDAIVYPTAPLRPTRIDADPPPDLAGSSALNATMGTTPTNLASLAGFPALVVPAGFTSGGLPVGISFMGVAFAEPRLLALGYAFEQRTRALRLPVHTPKLESR
jgi:amidase